jgi:syntaxin 16
MIQNEESIMRRDRELREILKSIVELNELFKEFSSLVVEQGTLLDRIDYNVETACSFVKEGNKNLISAEKYQKMSRMTLCLLLLIVFFLAVGLFVALKLFLKFGLSVNLPSLHIFQ